MRVVYVHVHVYAIQLYYSTHKMNMYMYARILEWGAEAISRPNCLVLGLSLVCLPTANSPVTVPCMSELW